MLRNGSAAFFCFALLVTAGCGSSKPPAYPVQGKITGGTSSVAGVVVSFAPLDADLGVYSSGIVKDDGTYSLETTDGRPGAVAGKYKVVLALGPGKMQAAMEAVGKNPRAAGGGGPRMPMMRPGMAAPPGGFSSAAKSGPPKFERPFPDSYSSASTSPKEVEVKSGSNVIDIQL